MTPRATVRWLALSSASIFVAVLLVVATSNILFTSADSRSIRPDLLQRGFASGDEVEAVKRSNMSPLRRV